MFRKGKKTIVMAFLLLNLSNLFILEWQVDDSNMKFSVLSLTKKYFWKSGSSRTLSALKSVIFQADDDCGSASSLDHDYVEASMVLLTVKYVHIRKLRIRPAKKFLRLPSSGSSNVSEIDLFYWKLGTAEKCSKLNQVMACLCKFESSTIRGPRSFMLNLQHIRDTLLTHALHSLRGLVLRSGKTYLTY